MYVTTSAVDKISLCVAKISFVVGETTLKVAVITFSVDQFVCGLDHLYDG